MTSIPVSFHTSGSDLVTSHKLSKVRPGQAKHLNRKLLRKNSGTVESRAGGWVGDIILLELIQKMCSFKKPLCIRCGSALAAKDTASQVSQTQRLQWLKLLTAFLPISPRAEVLTPLAAQAPHWVITSVPRAPQSCSFHTRGHTLLYCSGELAQAALLADSVPEQPAAQEEENWTYVRGKKALLFWKGAYSWKGNNEKPRNAHVKINLVPPALLFFPFVPSHSLSSLLRSLDSSETQAPVTPTVCCKEEYYTPHVLAESSFCCYGVNTSYCCSFWWQNQDSGKRGGQLWCALLIGWGAGHSARETWWEKNSPQTHNSNANYTWKCAAIWYHG